MWNKPPVLNAIADLLFVAAAAALLAALAVWLVRMPSLPVRQVVFTEELRHVRRLEVEQVLPAALKGNFFSLNLEAVRGALEKLPWVRRVDVRRVWPARLEVRVEEHVPVARWEESTKGGRNELVNSHGEVFAALLPEKEGAGLPLLFGPAGTAPELLQRHGKWIAAFAPLGRRPVQVLLSPRLSWQLRLDDGLVLDLGRDEAKHPLSERLARFVSHYRTALEKLHLVAGGVVDMRYPNGFALRVARKS